jgi:hypothetical protein
VDPFFLDAFHQQPSTPTYDKLLASLPRAFVGTAPELKQLVALLTAQSIKAYNVQVSRPLFWWLGRCPVLLQLCAIQLVRSMASMCVLLG